MFQNLAMAFCFLAIGTIIAAPFVLARIDARIDARRNKRRELLEQVKAVVNQDRLRLNDPRAKEPSLLGLTLDLLAAGFIAVVLSKS